MGLFGGGKQTNPADAGMPYLNEIPGTVTPYYNPYINLGKGAARISAPVYYQQVTNPQGYYNNIMSGYSQSPAEQYNQQQLLAQQAGTAAAGGFSGTPYDQQQQAATTNGLLAQDQQQYYNNVTGAQNQGLNAGMHYYDTGYQASNTLAQLLGANLAAQSGMAYSGAAFQDQMNAQAAQNRLGAIGFTYGLVDPYGHNHEEKAKNGTSSSGGASSWI